MPFIFGSDGKPDMNFTLNPGDTMRVWWWGFETNGDGAYIGSVYPAIPYTASNRVVAVDSGLEYLDWAGPTGMLHTLDLRAEDSRGTGVAAVFRIMVGQLV